MKLLWSKLVPMDIPWEPACAGVFYKFADNVHFLFKDGKAVGILNENSENVQKLTAEEKVIPLPNQWIFSEAGENPKLFLNEGLMLDIPSQEIRIISDPAMAEEYRRLRKPEKYYVEASFFHDGYEITHKGNFGYQCMRNGKKIWEFRGQGYLYTDICFREDRVFFGTAGQGGYFYVLDLRTGEPLAKIKTGGTASFAAKEGDCYVLTNEKTAKLLWVDMTEGHIRSETELPGKSSVYSRMKLMDGKVHAITFTSRKDTLRQVSWNCIGI